ncbi:DUF4282 domain-containing protein [Actinomadura sp. HBU206391]|uniref:DUF4282 domain-containing protein n=1 Tax=Actinomadura sp. HBU206391 TaxID=2731692 RepID=UPI0021C726C6|nr:DUF4282 domain-containing protein [Actinomadura sp. HBU206391]
MTDTPEPGRPHHPPGPGAGRSGGPESYGPPPRPAGSGPGSRPGPAPSPGPGPTPGPGAGPGPGAPGPNQPPPGWVPQPRSAEPEYSRKGFFGALFDLSFDHMVTIKLIRLVYVLAIGFTGITALAMLLLAWSFSEWNGFLALLTFVATPIVSLFQIVITRMILEFVINQFKITDELRKIRESGRLRS